MPTGKLVLMGVRGVVRKAVPPAECHGLPKPGWVPDQPKQGHHHQPGRQADRVDHINKPVAAILQPKAPRQNSQTPSARQVRANKPQRADPSAICFLVERDPGLVRWLAGSKLKSVIATTRMCAA